MDEAKSFLTLTDQISSKLETWLENSARFIPNIVLALIVLVLFYFISRFIKRLLNRPLTRMIDNKSLYKIVANLIFLVVFSTGLFIALELLNLEKTVTSLLAGAGVLGIALGFAFQELATNFIAGIFIVTTKPYKEGDTIAVGDQEGVVIDVNLRATSVETSVGHEVIVPNRLMLTQVVINQTNRPFRRVEIKCGVNYQSDLAFVEKIATESVKDLPFLSKNQKPILYFNDFAESSINFSLYVWIDTGTYPKASASQVKHQAMMKLKSAFEANKIDIPYPTRTILTADYPASR